MQSIPLWLWEILDDCSNYETGYIKYIEFYASTNRAVFVAQFLKQDSLADNNNCNEFDTKWDLELN